nr:MAG TPA: hypothetical protein [Caudoviricetes sp.]
MLLILLLKLKKLPLKRLHLNVLWRILMYSH